MKMYNHLFECHYPSFPDYEIVWKKDPTGKMLISNAGVIEPINPNDLELVKYVESLFNSPLLRMKIIYSTFNDFVFSDKWSLYQKNRNIYDFRLENIGVMERGRQSPMYKEREILNREFRKNTVKEMIARRSRIIGDELTYWKKLGIPKRIINEYVEQLALQEV